MIKNYTDVVNELHSRIDQKTLDNLFLCTVEKGAHCSPFVSNAILNVAKHVYQLNNAPTDEPSFRPGLYRLIGIRSSEPAGKALSECRKGQCIVTLDTGQEDKEIRLRDGVTGLRRARVLRITTEAHEQGIDLTQEDLAYNVFGCGVRTISRDIAYFREQGIFVPTRGQQKDIGPGISHKVLAVKLSLERKDPVAIARIIYHSLKAVERYTTTFARVAFLTNKRLSIPEIAFTVQISERLTRDYQKLYKQYDKPRYKERLNELIGQVEKTDPIAPQAQGTKRGAL